MSLGMMVTRLAWMAHKFVSSNSPTKYASLASWNVKKNKSVLRSQHVKTQNVGVKKLWHERHARTRAICLRCKNGGKTRKRTDKSASRPELRKWGGRRRWHKAITTKTRNNAKTRIRKRAMTSSITWAVCIKNDERSPVGLRWRPTGNADRSWSPARFLWRGAGKATCGWAARWTSGSDGSHEGRRYPGGNDGASWRRPCWGPTCARPSWPAACGALCPPWTYGRSAWYGPCRTRGYDRQNNNKLADDWPTRATHGNKMAAERGEGRAREPDATF